MINGIINTVAAFLRTTIIDNHVIFIDLWSIMHIIFGITVMILLIKLKKKNLFTALITILLIWELFEFANYQILGNSLFAKEKTLDIIWDLAFGLLGGTLTKLIYTNHSKSHSPSRKHLLSALSFL